MCKHCEGKSCVYCRPRMPRGRIVQVTTVTPPSFHERLLTTVHGPARAIHWHKGANA